MFLDVHAHFADEGYEFPQEWEDILSAGVERVVLAGDNLRHSAWNRDFAAEHNGVYFCAGAHPSETAGWGAEQEQALRALLSDEKCVAVGEIGLDYHYPDPDRETQKRAFVSQLKIAKEAGLPVQIHSRDAAADTLAILNEHRDCLVNGLLLHCYSYGRELMNDFLKLGAYFSFGGVACFKNARKVAESVAACPADRILSETDSPYLSPFRGEKNSPRNIPVIVERMAQLRGEEIQVLKEQIKKNAYALFFKLK